MEEHYLDTVGVGSSILPVPTSMPAARLVDFRSTPARHAGKTWSLASSEDLRAPQLEPPPSMKILCMLDLIVPMHGISLVKK